MAKYLITYDPFNGNVLGKVIVGSDLQAKNVSDSIEVTAEEYAAVQYDSKVNLETKKLETKK
jgi:hypothetical protein